MTGTKPRGNNRWSNLPASPAGSGSSSYSRGRGGDDIQPQSRQSPEAPQSIFGSIFGSLPPVLRDLLPFGPGATPDPDGKPPAAAPDAPSWQDVCFIHAIPGEDSDEGIVVLADGSLRKYIGCKGINALLFDEAEREQLARQFAALANSCDSDIQIIVMSRNLSVDEYLSRYQMLLKTDNEYLRW